MNIAAQIAIKILLSIDWAHVVTVIQAAIARRVPNEVERSIESLVVEAEREAPSGSRFDWVREQIFAPGSPVRDQAQATAQHLVNLAIEAAVAKLNTRNT